MSPQNTEKPSPAILFDVDGTLVDSNYLHVAAWLRAFDAEKVPVQSWRIHRLIGMDGTTLVRTLVQDDDRDPDADSDLVDRLKDGHSRFYQEYRGLLTPLPGARDLVRAVAATGLQVVLATSAPEDELSTLRDVLDCDDVVAAVTSSKDVDIAKPRPDIVSVALERAGVGADEAVFVGDAVWDCEAARRADLQSIGVLSGGVSRSELLEAGAAAVFEDPAELLSALQSTRIGELAVRAGNGSRVTSER